MKHFNLLLLITLFPFLAFSQINFKPGYVINLKGDTLKGYIDYRGWDANPNSISFKANSTQKEVREYTVNDINYFNISDIESYQKFKAKISTDITNIDKLGYDKDTSFIDGTVFFKVLQKGKNLALYSYTDNIKTRYFFGENPDFNPIELTYRVYKAVSTTPINSKEIDIEGNTAIENKYLKQLFSLAIKYNALDDGLTRILSDGTYKDYFLLDVFGKINQIKETKERHNLKTKVDFFAGLGVNIANTTTEEGSSYSIGGGKSFTSYLPMISGGINIIPNPSFGRVEIRLEVAVSKTKYDAEYKLLVSPYVNEKVYFDQLDLAFMPQIIFNLYNAPTFKMFIGGGLGIIHRTFNNQYFGAADPNLSDNGIGGAEPFYFNPNDTELFFKAGIKISKKVAINLTYITQNAITKGGYLKLNNDAFNIGLLYFFGN